MQITMWDIKEEGYLPQTNRASAFVVDRVNIFLASSLITMHNLIVAFHTVCVHVGFQNLGMLGPAPWDEGVAIP